MRARRILPPSGAPAGLIPARRPLRDDPLKPQGAGVPEHRLAVRARQVVAEDDRGAGAFQVLPEHRPALDELAPAEVLAADMQEIEG